MLQLSKDRTVLVQIGIGLVLGFFGAALVELFVRIWGGRPYLALLVLPMVASYVLGGSALSGTITTLTLMVFGLTFISETGWLPYSIFFATGILVAYLVKTTKDRIRSLSDAEIRALESERFQLAASAGQLGVWEWDIQNDKVVWDDQMLKFYGQTKDSFAGTVSAWENSLHPEDFKRAHDILEEAGKACPYFNSEFRIVRPDGEVRHIQAQALLTRDSLGSPLKMFGLNRDVTEEKANLQKIQELNAYLETALEQSQAGIVIAAAPGGEIRFANQASLQITDRSKEEVVENIDSSKYGIWGVADINGTPLDGQNYPIVKAMKTGAFIKEELLMVRPSGEKRTVFCNAAPIRGKDGIIIAGIVVFLDITEQHQLLEKVKAAQREAEEAMLAKARFLDVAAHELRTPCTAVSLMLQLAQRQIQNGQSVSASVLNRMKTQMDRLTRLVVDLLEVSKLDRGVLDLKYEWTDMGELVTDCISTFKIQFPERQIIFQGPTEPINLHLDPVRIFEVMANLLDNAIKYTPEDAPIEIELDANSENIYFSIRDHGRGLTEQVQNRLFSAFKRDCSDRSKRYSGLGLGLFISKGIINLHGGSIGLRSQVGQGSTFFFHLPRTPSLLKTGTEAL